MPRKSSNSSIWPINGTLRDFISLGQSGPESNCKEGVLYIPQTPRLEPHHLLNVENLDQLKLTKRKSPKII